MDELYLDISGIQHFAYCPRQWALIHLEQQWQENDRTVDGRIFHDRAHNGPEYESRGDVLICRGLRVSSDKLGLRGICDVVEFHSDLNGIQLSGREGTWRPYPVEYKKGEPKEGNADRLQLCAQVLCLEEMLLCSIPEGSLFYGETRRREIVSMDASLRNEVLSALEQMRSCYLTGYTPKARINKGCNACSLREICLPKIVKFPSVSAYIQEKLGDDT